MSTSVFVLDKKHRPLMPCRPARARRLLRVGRARVVKRFPFVIRLVDRTVEQSEVQPVLIKLDPGSRETGAAVVRDDEKKRHHALAFFVIKHRGGAIRDALKARSAFRRRRRSQNFRCRSPRFLNRVKPKGWLPPSLRHRVETTLSFVRRMCRYLPVSGIAAELVKFDSQKLQTPEVSGIEYQQGTLFEYEVREYLLEKFGRKCVYCGAEGVPLNIDHVVPRAKGGSNRVSNLVLACMSCNQKKGLPVETGSGALTKLNRHAFGVEKEHWLDALCVGRLNGAVTRKGLNVLEIRCMGRGSRQRTRLTKYGFPRGYLMRQKCVHGFATGDMVEANVPKGKKAGLWRGRVAVRVSGSFNIQTPKGVIQGVGWKHCRLISHNDGYGYAWLGHAPHSSPA